jgi:hypothetical protein
LKRFDDAFGAQGVDIMIFGKDVSHLIAANKDIRVFGLKSGKV